MAGEPSARGLILVRHARPQSESERPPPQWRLSDRGRADAERLAMRLAPFAPAAVLASTEPKAIETATILAAPLGRDVVSDPAFDEHRREAWPFEPDPAAVTARVLRALTFPEASIEGAETGAAARARFAGGLAAHPVRPLLVVTHGTILSLYAARAAGLQPEALWRSLGLPEALVFDGEGRLAERIA